MLREEFEARTGFYPTGEHYAAIEAAYSNFKGDKDAFCKAYKKNQDGMAEAIAREVSIKRIIADEKAKKETAARIFSLEAEVARLREALEREQEWKPYESPENVSQTAYEEKAASVESGAARYMEDAAARDWLFREFGFANSAVTILREVKGEEINRHRQIRKTEETFSRHPIYGASDDNYILFRAGAWFWEVLDGEIRQHVC